MHVRMMPTGEPASTARRVVLRPLARGRMALAALVVACAAPPRTPGTAVYASGADLESANPLVTVHPLSRQVQRYALFVTLARHDSALVARPYAARSWEWSSDRRRLTLHLEPALRWHDGRPTTARDVAFTLDAARDPATGYARYADLAAVERVIVADSATLVIAFAVPQPVFPPVLCELPILPEHLLGRVPRAAMRGASFNTSPVGNGPFRFVERRPGQRWVFARNPAFPEALGGPPRLERLVVAVVDEPTTKFAGLVSGDLDVAGIAPSTAPLAARDPSIRVLDYPQLFSYAMVFNVGRPPFDDVRVRRALSLAIDRERIVRAALAGFGVPAEAPVPADNPLSLVAGEATRSGNRDVSGRDVEEDARRADSLLDAAGWLRTEGGGRARFGRPLGFELLTVGSGDNAIEQLIQGDLAARGVRVEIRQLELGAFLATARARPKAFDALVTGIPGDLSLAYLAAMHDSRQAGGALDFGGYHTPRLDSLFRGVREATTGLALVAAWAAVQRELEAQTPEAWIYHARGVQGVARRLGGVTMDLRGEMATLARWYIEGEAAPSVAASGTP